MDTLISVDDAVSRVLERVVLAAVEMCDLSSATGRVLREDLVSDRDQPPFDRVAMDGIAICHASWSAGCRVFACEGVHRAGCAAPTLENAEACLEVMTGCVLPLGCDSVIRIEDLTEENGSYRLNEGVVIRLRQNVHELGSDRSRGDLLVSAGVRLNATHVAIAASVGKSQVSVSVRPKIAVVSNGDELVDVDHDVEPYQIRRSNVYAIQSALIDAGYDDVKLYHFGDDESGLQNGLGRILEYHDAVILSGGVSKGKFDYIPPVLDALGVEKIFHGVAQRPGKPIWFGLSSKEVPVFAMPGNPVSCLVCVYHYLFPYLDRCAGHPAAESEMAVLGSDFSFKPSLTMFLPVRIRSTPSGDLVVDPAPTNGSGDFCGLADSDGFAVLSADKETCLAGQPLAVHRWVPQL